MFKHIETILIRNDHAVVPGFGAFVIQKQPAQISGNIIHPPLSTISFNRLINNNDGVLIVEISRQKNISYRQAAKLTEKHVSDLTSYLLAKKSLEFGRIGNFTLNNSSELIFSPRKNLDFLPDNFGLNLISLPSKIIETRNINFYSTVRKFTQYAAMLITFFALLFSTGINKTPHVVTADLTHFYNLHLSEDTVNTLQLTDELADSEISTELNTSLQYKIIVAAFYTEDKALSVCNDFRNGDYPNAEVITSNGKSRISINLLLISIPH